MRQKLFMIRQYLSAILIHAGLNVMPDSPYKRELLRRMWELRYDIEIAFANLDKENTDGDQ